MTSILSDLNLQLYASNFQKFHLLYLYRLKLPTIAAGLSSGGSPVVPIILLYISASRPQASSKTSIRMNPTPTKIHTPEKVSFNKIYLS